MTIYVLSGFNNYYNRIVKKFDTVEEYGQFVVHTQQDNNFVPNDNVDTQLVLGTIGNQYSGEGDYLLVVNDLNEIVSRWFIIESVRDRAGQYTLTLHRDLIVDHYDEVVNAPMYIEKATLNETDPFIFNRENLSLNQIKTKEYQIKDKSDCAWIVGYLSRNDEAYGPYNLNISNTLYNEEMTQSEWESLVRGASNYRINDGYQFSFTVDLQVPNPRLGVGHVYTTFYLEANNIGQWNKISYNSSDTSLASPSLIAQGGIWGTGSMDDILQRLNSLSTSVNQQVMQIARMSVTSPITGSTSRFSEYLSYNGNVVKVLQSDGVSYKYYKVSSTSKTGTPVSYSITTNMGQINGVQALPTYLTNLVKTAYGSSYISGTFAGKIAQKYRYIDFSYEEVSSITVDNFSIPATRRQLEDAPYDMFCIPYKEDGLDLHIEIDNYETVVKTISKIETMSFAQQLAEKLGKNLLDIQLLPFCPLQGWSIDSDGNFAITGTGMEPNKDLTFKSVLDNSRAVVVFYSTKSEGTLNYEQLNIVDKETGLKVTGALPTTQGLKMSNQCDMYRLCSPNWNGQFEFTPAKCGNSWYQFNVDYTYLPYSPYIHINPNFSQLYGKDFDDARGLICQGDFSISYMSDQWVNYQVQNKNYLNTFNRGTENLELNQKVQRTQQVFNAVTGTIMGGSAGAAMGAKAGPWGAIAGAVVGTAAGAVGGALDVHYGDMLRNEALDYRQDMFNYSLDNIQALPDSIAKVTAYTKNNRIFPTIEYYTCTDTEKRALANKIAYNGMTTMRIGTINEFIANTWSYGNIESKGYVKGKLIRLETVEDDYHIVNALSGELDKGVYIR